MTNFRPALRVDDELRHHLELDVLGVTASVGMVVSQLQRYNQQHRRILDGLQRTSETVTRRCFPMLEG